MWKACSHLPITCGWDKCQFFRFCFPVSFFLGTFFKRGIFLGRGGREGGRDMCEETVEGEGGDNSKRT